LISFDNLSRQVFGTTFAISREKALTVSSGKQAPHQDNPGIPDPEGVGLDACRPPTFRLSKQLVSPYFRIKQSTIRWHLCRRFAFDKRKFGMTLSTGFSSVRASSPPGMSYVAFTVQLRVFHGTMEIRTGENNDIVGSPYLINKVIAMRWIFIGAAIATVLMVFLRFRGRKRIRNQDIAF
jgi:hypothetical protein